MTGPGTQLSHTHWQTPGCRKKAQWRNARPAASTPGHDLFMTEKKWAHRPWVSPSLPGRAERQEGAGARPPGVSHPIGRVGIRGGTPGKALQVCLLPWTRPSLPGLLPSTGPGGTQGGSGMALGAACTEHEALEPPAWASGGDVSNATYQQANQRQPPRKEEVKEPSPGARVPSPAVLRPGHRAGEGGPHCKEPLTT